MKHITPKLLLLTLLSCGMLISVAFAPKDDKPYKAQNLKVLPKDISKDSLIAVMHLWENSLGVDCGFCHARSDKDPKKLDFASDANKHKDFARSMYVMTDSINQQYFGWWAEHNSSRQFAVTCYTCHHGKAEPEATAPMKND